eukprot:403356992
MSTNKFNLQSRARNLMRRVKNLDLYGQTFQLTFKGEKEVGFDAAFGTSKTMTSDYGEFQVFLDTQTRTLNQTTGQIVVQLVPEQLELVQCGQDYFNYEDKVELRFKEVPTFKCIKDKSKMNVGGTFQSSLYQQVRVFLVPCVNNTSTANISASIVCKSKEEQKKFFDSVDMRTRYVYRYFDQNDYENPIKGYIEDKVFLPLQYEMKKGVEIHLRKNTAVMNDNPLPFQSAKEVTFMSTEYQLFFTSDLYRRGYSIGHINFRLDRQQDIYTRNVYSFSTLLADVGGIYNTLFLFGLIIASQFGEKIFYAKAIKEIFQTYDPQEQLKEKKKSQSATTSPATPSENSQASTHQKQINHKNLNESLKSNDDLLQANNILGKNLKQNLMINSKITIGKNDNRNQNNLLNQKSSQNDNHNRSYSLIQSTQKPMNQVISINPKLAKKNSGSSERNQLKNTGEKNAWDDNSNNDISSLIHKTKFLKNNENSETKDLQANTGLIDNIIALKFKCNKDKTQKKRAKTFEKAIKKLDHEFDAVNLMKTMKQVRLMSKVFMNETQNLLMGFQQRYVLDINNEGNEGDSDSEVDVVKTLKKMRSDNRLVRVLTLGRIKKQLTNYLSEKDKNVQDLDKRLLIGVFPKMKTGSKFQNRNANDQNSKLDIQFEQLSKRSQDPQLIANQPPSIEYEDNSSEKPSQHKSGKTIKYKMKKINKMLIQQSNPLVEGE